MPNLVVGSQITWEEPVFHGYYKNATFVGYRKISGEIIGESYGSEKGQHTFTILVSEISGEDKDKYKIGGKIRRKGRNLYHPNLIDCKDPIDYAERAKEKQERKMAHFGIERVMI